MPWGAIWCAALFLLVELATRFVPDAAFLGFAQHDYARIETLDYTAVDVAIEMMPPADVIVVGTSRAREGIHGPDLTTLLREQTGQRVSVRNYGVAAGRADVWPALFDRLVAEGKPPRVLIVALDASDFRDRTPTPNRYRFVDLATLGREIDRNGWPDERDATAVIGNSIPLRMMMLRPWVRHHLVHRGDYRARIAKTNNTAFGGLSEWARDHLAHERDLGEVPVMRTGGKRIERVVDAYGITAPRLRALDALVEATRAAGVALVLVEIPPAPQVRSDSGVAMWRAYLHLELDALAGPCVTTWHGDDAALDGFGKGSFRDPSHLSVRGARQLTRLIAPTVGAALAGCR